MRPGAKPELYYSYQPTTPRLEPAVGVRQDVAPMGVHYFLVGGRYEPVQSGRIMPFFVAGGGATLFDARRNAAGIDYGSEWLFAFRFAGGGTAWLTSRIPERRQQRLVAAVQQIMRGFPPTK